MAVTVDQLEIEIEYKTNNAADGITKLCNSLGKLQKKLEKLDFSKLKEQFGLLNESLESISGENLGKLAKLSESLEKLSNAKTNLGKAVPELTKVAEKAKKASSALREVTLATKGARKAMGEVISSENEKQTNKWSGALDSLKKSVKGLFAPVTKLVKAMGRIAFYRMIRSAMKAVSEGFQVGLSNAYQYSIATGFRLAKTLDSISSAAYKMKNQLGSFAAEVLSTLAPTLIRLANIVTKAADALAQFFAILQGHGTYLKAKDISKPWEEAAGATKKMKENLQGFDELNVISLPDTSGNTPDFKSMFEEVDVSEKIKKLVEWLRDNFAKILTLVAAIGAALLGWKIGTGLGLGLPKTLGLMSTLAGLALYIGSALDGWFNGVDWLNTLGMILGTVLAVGGAFLFLISLPIDATIAVALSAVLAFLMGIGMAIVAIHDWVKKGELTNAAFVLLEVGLALFSLANPIVGILGMIGVALYKIYQESQGFIAKVFPELATKIEKLKSDIIDNLFGPALHYLGIFVDRIKSYIPVIIGNVRTVYNKVKEIISKIGEVIGTIPKILEAIGIAKWFLNNVYEPISKLLTRLSELMGKVFGSIVKNIAVLFEATFVSVMNGAFMRVEELLNTFIKGFNKVINIVNAIPGVSIETIQEISLPRLARGGITTGATTALIGEAGQEAVLPLENNTGWMDKLAEKISQNIVVKFEVEGDPNGIFKVTQKEAQQYYRRTGRSAFA